MKQAAVRIERIATNDRVVIVAAAARFSPATLSMVLAVAVAASDRWIQGDDQMAEIRRLVRDLALDTDLLAFERDRVDILDRATATVRRLSALFRRDAAYGLVDTGDVDATALRSPDLVEAR